MKEKLLELFDEFEHQFETTGYYGSFAGYGIKIDDYDKLADRIISLVESINNDSVVIK